MIEQPSPSPEQDFLPDDPEDDFSPRPGLRRLFKVIYIVIVILVIVGLLLMFFPWERVPTPFKPPFGRPEWA